MVYEIKHIIIIVFLCMCSNFGFAMENPVINNDTIVKWIGKFPMETSQKTKFTKRITEIVTGKNEQLNIVRPVSVLAFNLDTFVIFDQKTGIPVFIKNNQIELIKYCKRNHSYFPSLVGSCFFSKGRILFTDSKLNKVFCISADQKKLFSIGDSLKLKQPTGIAYSPSKDEIWVVETAAHRISILNSKGELIKRIGKRGTGNGEFNYPTAIWIDDDEGICYIIDAMNFRIQIFNEKGEFISAFGKQGNASGYFGRPKGIATDSYHNIYITDALFHTVQIFDKKGRFLYNFGEQGRESGQFWMPSGIYIDKKNYIYISDTYNSRVQIFKINIQKY